jgi:hypothetical protein
MQQKFAALSFSRFFPQSITVTLTIESSYNYIPYVRRDITSIYCLLFKVTLSLNSAVPFWKRFVFEFLLHMSVLNICSSSKTVPLLDALQLLMFAVMLTCVKRKVFLIIIVYILYFLIINYYNINCTQYYFMCIYIYILIASWLA